MPAADLRLVIICPDRTGIIARDLVHGSQTVVFA